MTTTSSEREKQPTICIKKITRNEKKRKGEQLLYNNTTIHVRRACLCIVYQPRKTMSKSKRNTQKKSTTPRLAGAGAMVWEGGNSRCSSTTTTTRIQFGRRHVTFNCDLFICTCLAQSCGALVLVCWTNDGARGAETSTPSEDDDEDDAYFVWWILLIKSCDKRPISAKLC